jgi:DNA invertase Pin-like site-specific DNA recombinase
MCRNHADPDARFLLHILMAAAEFERELIRERAAAGLRRYRTDYDAGKVGKETRSRSGRNLPGGRQALSGSQLPFEPV